MGKNNYVVALSADHGVADPPESRPGARYAYDRDVPIIFYGATIHHGSQPDGVMTVDVAPTLGAAAGIRPPAGLDGHPLSFVLNTEVDGSRSTRK